MENIQIGRDNSAQIRPALRPIMPANTLNVGEEIVGGFEHFYLADGTKALLYAKRLLDNTIRLCVIKETNSTDPTWGTFYEHINWATAMNPVITQITFSEQTKYVRYLQIDNRIFILPNSPNPADHLQIIDVGVNKSILHTNPITVPAFNKKLDVYHPDQWQILNGPEPPWTIPPTTPDTLICDDDTKNTYFYSYFYTISNDIGESAASDMTHIRAQRSWVQWRREEPNIASEPNGNITDDPTQAADQFIALMPEDVYDTARAEGATHWSLYAVMWSNQSAMPVDAILVDTKPINQSSSDYNNDGWIRHQIGQKNYSIQKQLPQDDPLLNPNYSDPGNAAQGIVAGDRVILVKDARDGARIKWGSNQLGSYTEFTPIKNGGYKTLTHGNLQTAATIKLWQNPQSVDTLTILCMGLDGYSTSYYMSPAEVEALSEKMAVMGFEETTATPGTTSPFGCEVHRNSLFHPLDDSLMKSSTANYAIHHKSLTDSIANKWVELRQKHNIVSCEFDNNIYYIVDNPDGEPTPDGCMGNEIWVHDTISEVGSWSRYLIPAVSLKKLEHQGKLYLAVIQPNTISILDKLQQCDTVPTINADGYEFQKQCIPWKLETNLQGSNRTHDQWARIQQVKLFLGNFYGEFEYGIKGLDKHGKPFNIHKRYEQPNPVEWDKRPMPYDHEDHLLTRTEAKQWYFYAHSVNKPTYGQISLVQYRFTPLSVNIQYETGSVQTHEYARARDNWTQRTTINGIPIPEIDPRRPADS